MRAMKRRLQLAFCVFTAENLRYTYGRQKRNKMNGEGGKGACTMNDRLRSRMLTRSRLRVLGGSLPTAAAALLSNRQQ